MPRLVLCLALLLPLAVPQPARACDIALNSAVDGVLPRDGATGVPTNTALWVDPSTPNIRLVDAAGVEVKLKAGAINGRNKMANLFKPEVPLAPNARYRVMSSGVIATFTTGAEADTTAPAPPTEVRRDMQQLEGQGSFFYGPISDCGELNEDRVLARFTVSHDGVMALVGIDGEVKEPSIPEGGGMARDLDTATNELQFILMPGEKVKVRYASLDLAGNFSGWSEPVDVQAPDMGFGCSTAAGNLAPVGVALLALALAFRRRA